MLYKNKILSRDNDSDSQRYHTYNHRDGFSNTSSKKTVESHTGTLVGTRRDLGPKEWTPTWGVYVNCRPRKGGVRDFESKGVSDGRERGKGLGYFPDPTVSGPGSIVGLLPSSSEARPHTLGGFQYPSPGLSPPPLPRRPGRLYNGGRDGTFGARLQPPLVGQREPTRDDPVSK